MLVSLQDSYVAIWPFKVMVLGDGVLRRWFGHQGRAFMSGIQFSSVQSFTHVKLFPTSRTAAHQASLSITKLLGLNQAYLHWARDAIQQSHLLYPSRLTFNFSQHKGLFKWVSSSHQVAKVLEPQLQHQSFQCFPLGWSGWISLQAKGLSRVFSNTAVQKHQFFGTQLSL